MVFVSSDLPDDDTQVPSAPAGEARSRQDEMAALTTSEESVWIQCCAGVCRGGIRRD